jgi:hypothetical protein
MDLKEYHGKVFPVLAMVFPGDTFCYLFENKNSGFK